MSNTENNRRHTRLIHRAKVQLSSAGESVIGYTKNLSDSGLFVFATFSIPLAIGDILEVLALDIEDALPKPVIVKHIEPGAGIGVEFI
jgi:hypothetical protein